MTNEEIVEEIFLAEGDDKFTDDPDDRGGATKFGITQKTLDAVQKELPIPFRGGLLDQLPDSVKDLNRPCATAIYECVFIHKPGFSKINDDRLRYLLVDCGVLHGPGRAIKWLQRAAGTTADGKIGPVTLATVNTAIRQRDLYLRVCRRRIQFISRIVAGDHSQIRFLKGWINRATKFLEF